MSVDKVFCNVPWFEVHINADGTYHTCGAQPNTISNTKFGSIYNVHNMSIAQWMDSEFQTTTRSDKLNGIPNDLCSMCYHEESIGSTSKRIQDNRKSNIFHLKFFQTFKREKFENQPPKIERMHISLGNECNLACKMCSPLVSSKLAVMQINAGTYSGPARINWTDNDAAWESVTDFVCKNEHLKFLHLLGGEPLLNPKLNSLLDKLILHNQTDIYIGFTTNGTVFDHELLDKLNKFRHVDIGISIECTGKLNDLIRHGSDHNKVLENIKLYLKYRKQGQVYVTLRTVPSALSVHTIKDLYAWCVSNELDILTNVLVRPAYMQIHQLPSNIKERLLREFGTWTYSDELVPVYKNPRDPTWFRQHIDNEIKSIIEALKKPNDPVLTDLLYSNLERWGWLDDPEIRNYFI